MPSIFIYEYMVATYEESDSSMLIEGQAMLDAITVDFVRAGFTTVDQHDADYSLIIAPECYRILNAKIHGLNLRATKSLNCSYDATALCSDKLELADYWIANKIMSPRTAEARQWWSDRLPAIVKPRDGAGSTDVQLITDREQWDKAAKQGMIAQDFVPGQAASIAFLVGPKQTLPLTPTFQLLSADGTMKYLGGKLPIPPDLAERAVLTGWKAIDCIPGLRGYVGVDLVLGDAEDGSQDYAIEINPRLTTSYVGLRALADFNLAQAMLDVVEGRPVDYIKWKPGRVRFWPDGRVEYDPTPGAVWE